MQIYEYNPQNIAVLNNPTSVMYRDDGTIDVDLLQQSIHRFGQCVTYYDALHYLYYVLHLPLKEQKEIDTALSFWKTVIERHPGVLSKIQSNLKQLDKYNISYAPHIQWLMQAYPINENPKTAQKTTGLLATLGLATYLQQNDTTNASVVTFLPPNVEKLNIKEILNVGWSKYPLDYKKLITKIKTSDSVAIQKYMVLAAFATALILLEKIDDTEETLIFDLEHAIDMTWPQFEALNISLTEVLHRLRKITARPELPNAVLEWRESEHAKKYPKALENVDIFVREELQQLAGIDREWKTREFPWAKLASNLDPTDPLYAITRKRIAQAIIAEQSQKISLVSDIEALRLALRSGKETLKELFDAWQKKGYDRIDEHLTSLFCDADTDVAGEMFNHPLINKYVPAKKLLESIYASEDLYDDMLYEMYTNIHDSDMTFGTSEVAATIIRMSEYHQKLKDGTSFKDTIGLPLYLHFWSILGFEMYFTTQTNMAGASDFVPQNASGGIPDALHAIMCLDPEFYRTHRADVASIIASPNPKDAVPIYKRWLTELFGPLHGNQDLQDLMIRDGKGIEQFFTQMYLEQHPELGYNVTEALSLDGL